MSSPSVTPLPTPRRGTRSSRRVDFVRPPDVDANHPVPWFGWDVRHAVPLRPNLVYQTMAAMKPIELPPGRDGKRRGAVINFASNSRVKEATRRVMPTMTGATAAEPMALRTVGHCIEHLLAKGLIDRWDTDTRAKHSPFGSSYRIVPWEEVQQRWRDNPEIAKGPRGGFFVWKKGKNFLTPGDTLKWGVDAAKAEADPRAHASAIPMNEPAAPAPKPAAARPAPPTDAELEDLKIALVRSCDGGATLKDARYFWGTVAEACGARPTPPVMDVAAMVYGIRDLYRKTGNRNPLNLELMRRKIGGAIETWQLNRQDLAEAATGTGPPRRPGYSPGDPRA